MSVLVNVKQRSQVLGVLPTEVRWLYIIRFIVWFVDPVIVVGFLFIFILCQPKVQSTW